ncbi:MAG: aminopeptidase [Coriobacteriales bacterium]|nr:aminopeptidase [Coriobacteriales bacterium]
MERKNAWKEYSEQDIVKVDEFAQGYIEFISQNKTERECAQAAICAAEAAGYKSLEECIAKGKKLKANDKVWATAYGKTILLAHIGAEPLENGVNILGAHIDSPRLDIKQNPLYEATDFAMFDTHYYGGIKKYQWVTLPLAIHGVVVKADGTQVTINVGEDPQDPVFCVSDLLIHLSHEQLQKTAAEVISGEMLDLIIGSRPLVIPESGQKPAEGEPCDPQAEEAKKHPVQAYVMNLLAQKYGIEEEDFLSAELEVVPAGPAREMGFDRSMILGYGQDDRSCAYASLIAQLKLAKNKKAPARTAVTLLVDKEEIGSVGATGMHSRFFENTMAEIMALAGEKGELALRRALKNSRMLSCDVSAGVDPNFTDAFEAKNASFLGRGVVFNKFTGARGKGGSNDANAEYMALVRKIMQDAGVYYQTAELGRVDLGGGGTIAYILAEYGMNVIDSGVAVLSMHSPWEVTSKADMYEAYKGYHAFLLSK